jgi:hypothetical protein
MSRRTEGHWIDKTGKWRLLLRKSRIIKHSQVGMKTYCWSKRMFKLYG